ncbi:MAG: NuoM family protein [Chitinophagaceae bacterium]|jgi:NADH-quinone oxidoreductase subunit M
MYAAVDNFPALLIWLPLVGALLAFFMRSEAASKNVSVFFSLLALAVVGTSLFYVENKHQALNQVSYVWLPGLESSFSFILDGLTRTLCLLTAISFPLIFLFIPVGKYKQPNAFYGLMMLTQCGLMGVFMATDALVFYLFWELALIPVYFLSSIWGGEKRIRATFKFFIYTFVGSLFMLIGIIYIYLKTSGSFNLVNFYNAALTNQEQGWLFALFFIAFAIKMPLFPFHTWQPDAYEQSPTPVTMVLSGIMVKMGLFGLLRWLIAMLPAGAKAHQSMVFILAVVGMIYASLIAIRQDNIKRLIAYSSIAHIGLMALGVFTFKQVAVTGVVMQMFTHGINVIALWMVADLIERQTGTMSMKELGGLAKKAPNLAIFMLVFAFANIALPLTNAFVGEFMIFSGVYDVSAWWAAGAGISIILSAVYTLNMVKNVFYGEVATVAQGFVDIRPMQSFVFVVLTVLIFFVGVYPGPFLSMIGETVTLIVNKLTGI